MSRTADMKHLPSLAALLLLASCQRLDIATPLTSEFPLVQYSQAPGVYTTDQQVSLSVPAPASDWDGTRIVYTTNPAEDLSRGQGLAYNGPVTVSNTGTLRARLVFGPKVGPESGAAYVLATDPPAVSFSPTGGLFYNDVTLTITQSPEAVALGGVIKFTNDGTVPTSGSADYTAPVTITGGIPSVQISARSYLGIGPLLGTNSAETYMFQVGTPVLNPPPGSYATAQNVTVTTETFGASLLYSLDGSAPSLSYGTPVLVSNTLTFRALGTKTDYGTSIEASGLYTITGGVNITLNLDIPNPNVDVTVAGFSTSLGKSLDQNMNVSVTVTGGTATSYQWLLNGSTLAGETANAVTIQALNVAGGSPTNINNLVVGNYLLQLLLTVDGQNYILPQSGSLLYFQVVP